MIFKATLDDFLSYIAAASVPNHTFLEFFFIGSPHNTGILYKPLAALPHCHRRNSGQR